MADNTTLPGTGDVISTDDVTTLNGGVSSGVKVQRNKVTWGADNTSRDTSGAFPLPVTVDGNRLVTYNGHCATFRTPGRAGTTGQKIFAIHNATGSSTIVCVNEIMVSLTATVIKAVTVLPPMISLYRVTVVPTNGTAAVKTPEDTTQTSSASVTIWGDASADGTSSATTLTATLTTQVIDRCFANRMITAAGFDMIQPQKFIADGKNEVILRPLEGIVVMLDYVLATQNPVTDMWNVSCDWVEYTEVA